MNKKYQVFISSTFTDLKEERQDISRSILNLDHIPAGMELFPAIDEDQLGFIQKVIDDCDYYVLIIGGRYGSLSETGVSFTEREYDYAIGKGLKVIALIHGNVGQISVANSDTEPAAVAHLNAFRDKVKSGRMVKFWTDRASLRADFIESFSMTISRFPAIGWVRGNTVANETILSQINAVRDENDRLKAKVANMTAKAVYEVPGIASLDDSFSIRYSYTEFYNRESRTHFNHAILSWKQIFAIVSPDLLKPTPPSTMKTFIKTYMLQNNIVSKNITIVEDCYSAIKIQFMALGLIDVYEAEAKAGGVSEFARLTEKGKSVMVDSLAVRRMFPS